MTTATKTGDITLERTIPAPPDDVFDAWLDPKVPGSPWHEHEKLIADTKVDGLWHWRSVGGTPHYGRFIALERPGRIQISWMSSYTLGQESIVTVTFAKKAGGTLMTLVHAGLPNDAMGEAHSKGWTSIADKFGRIFAGP